MTDHAPYASEREASAAARAAIPPEPGWSILSQAQRAELLHRALDAAGVEVSEYEDASAWWLGNWSDHLVAVIARWVTEAAEPEPGTETEWAVQIGNSQEVTSYDEGTARHLMAMLRENGTPAVLYRREVGPWLAADEPATGGKGEGNG